MWKCELRRPLDFTSTLLVILLGRRSQMRTFIWTISTLLIRILWSWIQRHFEKRINPLILLHLLGMDNMIHFNDDAARLQHGQLPGLEITHRYDLFDFIIKCPALLRHGAMVANVIVVRLVVMVIDSGLLGELCRQLRLGLQLLVESGLPAIVIMVFHCLVHFLGSSLAWLLLSYVLVGVGSLLGMVWLVPDSVGVVWRACLVWCILCVECVAWIRIVYEEFFVVVFLFLVWFRAPLAVLALVFVFLTRAWLVYVGVLLIPHAYWALDCVVEDVLDTIRTVNWSFIGVVLQLNLLWVWCASGVSSSESCLLAVRIKPIPNRSLLVASALLAPAFKLLLHPNHHLPLLRIRIQQFFLPEILLRMPFPFASRIRTRRVHQPIQQLLIIQINLFLQA